VGVGTHQENLTKSDLRDVNLVSKVLQSENQLLRAEDVKMRGY
jgi:hypothetical protein